jgi:hypothetical protein
VRTQGPACCHNCSCCHHPGPAVGYRTAAASEATVDGIMSCLMLLLWLLETAAAGAWVMWDADGEVDAAGTGPSWGGTQGRACCHHPPMGPHSSTGSPITFMMRPRVPRPTGTCIWMKVRKGWVCVLLGQPAEGAAAAHLDGGACVHHLLPAHQTVRAVHGNAAHVVVAQVLGHFEHQAHAVILHLEG